MASEHKPKIALFPAPYPERDLHSDECPGCGHVLGVHAHEIGCVHGWTYDRDGIPATEGCMCHLTLCDEFNPPAEREL